MFNYSSNYKRIGFVVIFILLGLVPVFNFRINQVCYAADDNLVEELNDNIDRILNDIDLSCLDDYSFNGDSFEQMAKTVLNGEYYNDYNSLLSYIKAQIFNNFKSYLRFFILLIIISILFELFKSFCSDKYCELKNSIKIIFSFLFATLVLVFVKNYYQNIFELVDDLFKFSGILFPILITLVTLSGSTSTASIFSSFSVFLIETGSYLIKFVLLPLSISILLLSLFSSIFSNGKISRVIDICKMIFKYTIVIFLGIVGLLSTSNIVVAGVSDGVNLKLTKFALKNYVPILGGYISDGFDFLHSCSVLIKNAVGVCSIIILVFKIVQPLILTVVFAFGFKFVSAVLSYVGDGEFSNMFNDVSKSFSNFLTIIIGSFLIVFIFIFLLIISVGVVG